MQRKSSSVVLWVVLLMVFVVTGLMLVGETETPTPIPTAWSPGGASTLPPNAALSSIAPSPALPRDLIPKFNAGRALAHQPWVKAPTTTTARDGLGPLYNVRACLDCHINGGRGRLPDEGQLIGSAVVRLGRTRQPTPDERDTLKIVGVLPDPLYGDQIQIQSVSLADQLGVAPEALGGPALSEPPAEAKVLLDWREQEYEYPDGATITLRRPSLSLTSLAYGELASDTVIALRNAPVIHGAGLIDAIAETTLLEWVDERDANDDGISGRANRVWNRERQHVVLGRFGWKANTPDLQHAVAAAFANDIGITNPLFPEESCTPQQQRCRRAASGAEPGGVELPARLLTLTRDFVASAAVPAMRELSEDGLVGRDLFRAAGCHRCHRPSLRTGIKDIPQHLAGQEIWPYSDFLLHDMGAGLADERSDFLASGSEWRTAPLWGIGLSERINGSNHYLHDGRARSIEEAILWHGGEAEASRIVFTNLSVTERAQMLSFVRSL